MSEVASIYAQTLIETLLKVHALANMHRSSENDEYRQAAEDWLPALDGQFYALKRALSKSSPLPPMGTESGGR